MASAEVLPFHGAAQTANPKDQLASTVAVDLAQSEGQLDLFLASLGQGLTTMAAGRRSAGLRPCFGQTSLERYAEVISHGIAMRGAMIQIHAGLAKEARREGIDWRLLMPTESTPDEPVKENVPKG